ncbi:Piwi domain-containing protein [Lacihabitans soyangensis]|uniref:Protein argonaute n=1 Tax=Lacihabitans soyangensis TaxID=869394 RepID=A0AAE3KQW5_9BACT|nr:Piwi domain-containing protein [Lacihabitans soyangensis]MCP9761483.1 hypothetical protein [Lacihabitans soyangensis]
MTTLEFNVLTFNHLAGELTIHFSNQEYPGTQRIFNKLVPAEVLTHFGEQEHYYMDFENPFPNSIEVSKFLCPQFETVNNGAEEEEKVYIPDACFSGSIVRRYYNFQIYKYFQSKNMLVKPSFISDIEVWVFHKNESDKLHWQFKKFSLKVQLAKLSKSPELIITYEGISKVLKETYYNLIPKVSPDSFNWFIFERNFFKYEDLPEMAKRESEKVQVVLRREIAVDLNYPAIAPDRSNRYAKSRQEILEFRAKYLHNGEFITIIPSLSKDFLKVKPARVDKVSSSSNQLVFGNKNQGIVPKSAMSVFGPLEIPNDKHISFFYIYHKEDESVFQKFASFMAGLEPGFKGFQKYCHLGYHSDHALNIVFENSTNPLREIEMALSDQNRFSSNVRYIAFYISPISKHTTDLSQREVYYKVKQSLLNRGITSQALDSKKVFSDTYHYSMPNISIAVLAKLNGIPWRLATTIKNELIVGVGAFRNSATDTQFIGSAFSFTNTGEFNQMECFMKSQTDELAGSIILAVRKFVSLNTEIKRLIIHFYKNMSQEELKPIEDGLRELDVHVPVYIVSINKTESRDLVAFDTSWPELMPQSGTYINLGRNKYLLFNNTRYFDTHNPSEGFPFPIKLAFFCTDQEKLKGSGIIQELLDQVYQFSRMYWKSISQQNLPVTIKYPSMVAEMVPHFDGYEIPMYGKSNLWFL